MKNIRKFIELPAFVLAVIVSARTFCLGIDSSAGTSGATFMKLGAGSPRAQALGRAYVALAEGPEALVWNPAGVALSQLREIHFAYLDWFQDYSGQYIGYVHPIGQTVIGANLAYFSIDGFDVRDENGYPQQNENVRACHGFGTFSIARSFYLERLFLGVSIKGIVENNDGLTDSDDRKYTNIVFDTGVLFKVGRRLSLGWAAQNVAGESKDVVRIFRIGAAYNPASLLNISLEHEMPSDNKSRLGIGMEFILPEQILQFGRVSFRAGYHSSDDFGKSDDNLLKRFHMDKTSGISLGFGICTSEVFGYGMAFDYAMIPYGALGKSNQISVRFQF